MTDQRAPGTYFHTTDAAERILGEGFRDGSGTYLMTTIVLTGVFIADMPVNVNEGAIGDQVLEVVLPDDTDLDDFELVEEGKPYREWCVPAELINRLGTVRLLADDEVEQIESNRWAAQDPDGRRSDSVRAALSERAEERKP